MMRNLGVLGKKKKKGKKWPAFKSRRKRRKCAHENPVWSRNDREGKEEISFSVPERGEGGATLSPHQACVQKKKRREKETF